MHTVRDSHYRLLPLLLLFEVTLIAATWPLWFSGTQFPMVPLLSVVTEWPLWIDQVSACLLIVFCLAGMWFAGRRQNDDQRSDRPTTVCIAGCAVSGSLLVVLNQHRLQPWHWLFLLLQLQTLLVTAPGRVRLYRLTFASVYIFAGVSRMGPQVATGVSPQVLHTLVGYAGLSKLSASEAFVSYGCWAMSIIEVAVGLALMWPKSRRTGVCGAVATHAILLIALSPLGLNHHWGVLLWNLFLLLAIPLLFWRPPIETTEHDSFSTWRFSGSVALIIGFPAASLVGITDNWPGWQVYSPRTDVVQLLIRTEDIGLLPDGCQEFVGPPLLLQDVCPVRIDRWSLFETRSPLYPEDRFQLAVVAKLIRDIDPAAVQMTLTTASKPNWWTQQKTELQPLSPSQLQDRFLLNTATRRFN